MNGRAALVVAALLTTAFAGCSLNDAPNVTSISPNSGPRAGGTQVTINGSGFTSQSQVFIGGQPATNVQFSSSTSTSLSPTTPGSTAAPTPSVSTTSTLIATTPAASQNQAADITIINRDGQRAHLKKGFSYIDLPTITTFSPTQNLAGAQETINGTGFEAGVTVNFGGTDAAIVGVTGSSVTVTVPAEPSGQTVVTVTLTNPDGGSTSSSFTYGVPPTASTTTTPVTPITPAGGTSGTITTIAGSATKNFGGDGSAATQAQLSGPSGLAVGTDGSVYIADTGNNRIRQINPAGTIQTIAGNGTAGKADGAVGASELSGPRGLGIDGQNNLYVADTGNNAVRLFASGTLSTYAGGGGVGNTGDQGLANVASLSAPLAVACDQQGNLFIADTGNNRVRRVDVASKDIANFAGQSSGNGGVANGDGGPATSATLNQPSGVAIDSTGILYISDRGNFRIRKVDTSGTITTFAGTGSSGPGGDGGPATAAEFGTLGDLGVDASNSLYIADSSNNRVRLVTASNLQISTFAGNGTASFSGDDGPATSASLNTPAAVFVNKSSGVVIIADSGDGSVRQVH